MGSRGRPSRPISTNHRVNHDILIDRLKKRIDDTGVIRLIRAYLNSGIMSDGVVQERYQGTPQGGPLSPLLANVLLDEVDKELERRGPFLARHPDELHRYVPRRKDGGRGKGPLAPVLGQTRANGN